MKRLLTTLVFVLTASLIVQAEDLLKYLRDTQDLARAGEYEEAAERYLWFHNHVLEHEPAMNGVRLSSALMSWKELGDVYPPALASIKKVRNEKTDILVQKMGIVICFMTLRLSITLLKRMPRLLSCFEYSTKSSLIWRSNVGALQKMRLSQAKPTTLSESTLATQSVNGTR